MLLGVISMRLHPLFEDAVSKDDDGLDDGDCMMGGCKTMDRVTLN
jgi:hypothetical protein